MANPNRWCFLIACLVLILLLAGCGRPDANKHIVIPSSEDFDGIMVSESFRGQKGDENESLFIKDKSKVREFIKEVNGKELVLMEFEELLDKRDELKEVGGYEITLFKLPITDSSQDEMYHLTFYRDGTIEVSQIGNTYFVKNRHPNLLNQMKTGWNITF